MKKVFNPQTIEKKWYKKWESSGYFKANPKSMKLQVEKNLLKKSGNGKINQEIILQINLDGLVPQQIGPEKLSQ